MQAGGLLISISRQQPIACKREIVAQTEAEKNNLGVNWKQVALDEAALPEDLLVRPRRPGDRALVVQRRKRIKLKKLMIDHKIASSRRASHPVVTTLDGEYVWSPGLPPALRFAAHDRSTSLAILRATSV